ncbi:hypothetical protein ACFLZB_03280 [Nanoarchaeota archaeon]
MAKKTKLGGLLIPGGLLIGMGVGFIIDELVGAMFIGLGIGFVAAFIAFWAEKKK